MMQQPAPQTTPYIGTWLRTFDFVGRSTRTEYWTFVLINLVVLTALTAVGREAGFGIGVLVLALPSISVTIRRLRDALGTGWWFLLVFVPFGQIVVQLILPLLPSRPVAPSDAGYDGGTAVDRSQTWGSDAGAGGNDPWDRR